MKTAISAIALFVSLFQAAALRPAVEAVSVSRATALNPAAGEPVSLSLVGQLNPLPGETVVIRNGTYADINLNITCSGESDKSVVFKAETPGGVNVVGKSRIRLSGSCVSVEGFRFDCGIDRKGSMVEFLPSSSHCRITDCVFDGTAGENWIENHFNLVIINGTANEISHCSFLDKKTKGVMVAVRLSENAQGGHLICNNYFTRPTILRPVQSNGKPGKPINGQECVQVGLSQMSMLDFKTVVRDNWFYHCDGEIETISGKSCGNIYEHNFLDECNGSITQRHGNDCIIRDNYIDGKHISGSGGIRIIGERHLVENNKIMNLRGGGGTRSAVSVIRGFKDPLPAEYFQARDVTVRDNWIIDCDWGVLMNFPMRAECVMPPTGLKVIANTVVCKEPDQVSFDLRDMPQEEVAFSDNVIIGGTQNGVSLPAGAKSPSAATSKGNAGKRHSGASAGNGPDKRTMAVWASEMSDIRKNAGAGWMK